MENKLLGSGYLKASVMANNQVIARGNNRDENPQCCSANRAFVLEGADNIWDLRKRTGDNSCCCRSRQANSESAAGQEEHAPGSLEDHVRSR